MKTRWFTIFLIVLTASLLVSQERPKNNLLGKVIIDKSGAVTIVPLDSVETGNAPEAVNNLGNSGSSESIYKDEKPDEETEKFLQQQYIERMGERKQNLITKTDGIQNFEELYQEFLNNQQSPLFNAQAELFHLNGLNWQRYFGEKEYFLVPSVTNVSEYKKRIKQFDDKQTRIIKSNYSILDVEITDESIRMLSEMGITVPSYINNTLKAILPQIDID